MFNLKKIKYTIIFNKVQVYIQLVLPNYLNNHPTVLLNDIFSNFTTHSINEE